MRPVLHGRIFFLKLLVNIMRRTCSINTTHSFNDIGLIRQAAFHEAGHAAAIHIGNRQKQLPPIFFQIFINQPHPTNCVFWLIWTPILVELEHLKANASMEVNFYSKCSTWVKEFIFFRIDSPCKFIRWALCINRSKIASAKVLSPIASYHCSVGNWLIMRVADCW